MEVKLKNLIKESSFDGAPGGTAGTLAYAPTLNTFNSPSVSQSPDKFHTSDKNKTPETVPPSGSIEKDVEAIFDGDKTPSPDDIISAYKYEYSKMTTPDKNLAKTNILKNLKEDPHYYTKLNMMNIDDKQMKVEETKNILKQMMEEKQQPKNEIADVNKTLVDTLNQMWEEKKNRRKF
jgi:hypothetical protein